MAARVGRSLERGGILSKEVVALRSVVHDPPPSYRGEFRKQEARAELRRPFESEASNRVFSEFTSGIAGKARSE